MDHRSTASFGKRMEYVAISELLRRRFDVYMTLVDDQGIDCVIRQERNSKLRYLDVQIKARSKDAKQAATFAAMEFPGARKNFWFIFYSEAADTYWVMPSLDLIGLARKTGEARMPGNTRSCWQASARVLGCRRASTKSTPGSSSNWSGKQAIKG